MLASTLQIALSALLVQPALAARKNIIIDTDIFSDCESGPPSPLTLSPKKPFLTSRQ